MFQNRRFLNALIVLAVVVAGVSGCGGGSGGGTNAPGNIVSDEIRIGALSPQSINMTLSRSRTGTSQMVLKTTYSGSTNDAIYVLIEDADRVVIAGSVTVDSSKASASLSLTLDRSLPPGTYTRPVTLRACKDAQCVVEFAGSPQTIAKNVVIAGITLGTPTLSFDSSAGIAPAAQPIAVTTPAGSALSYGFAGYVDYTRDGGKSLLNIREVFEITPTSTGLLVQPKARSEGLYQLSLLMGAGDFASETVNITYRVGPPAKGHVTILTESPSATGAVNSHDDIPVVIDILSNLAVPDFFMGGETRIGYVYDPATPVSGPTGWLRHHNSTPATYGSPPAPGTRMVFYANTCFTTCQPAGVYRANIVMTISSFGFTDTYTIPVTFTVR